MNIREYWNPKLSSFGKSLTAINSYDNYNEAEDEDEDTWDCDEDGHVYKAKQRPRHTNCIYCNKKLVKTHINGETVYVDPNELEKLEQWNAMSRGGEG